MAAKPIDRPLRPQKIMGIMGGKKPMIKVAKTFKEDNSS